MTMYFHSSPARQRLEQAYKAPTLARPNVIDREVRPYVSPNAVSKKPAKVYDPDEIKRHKTDILARALVDKVRGDEKLTKMFVARSKRIIDEVCAAYDFDPQQIKPGARHKALVLCRQRIAYRMAAETKLSLPAIGRAMGGFDHTTILSGIRKHARINGLDMPRGMTWGRKR